MRGSEFFLARLIAPLLGFALPLLILAWAIERWRRAERRFESPVWRSYFATGAFGLGALSFLLWIAVAIWARARGGFPYYDPILLRCYSLGFLSGAVGFLASLPGKGKLRWPGCFLSFLMAVLWVLAAEAE